MRLSSASTELSKLILVKSVEVSDSKSSLRKPKRSSSVACASSEISSNRSSNSLSVSKFVGVKPAGSTVASPNVSSSSQVTSRSPASSNSFAKVLSSAAPTSGPCRSPNLGLAAVSGESIRGVWSAIDLVALPVLPKLDVLINGSGSVSANSSDSENKLTSSSDSSEVAAKSKSVSLLASDSSENKSSKFISSS